MQGNGLATTSSARKTGVRFAVLAVVLGGLLLGPLAACHNDAGSAVRRSDPTKESGRSGVRGRLHGATSFALALGVDPLDSAAVQRLRRYDVVVVDGADTTPSQILALKAHGALVLGYLSVGTLEPGRRWFATARKKKWLLDHWSDWDEWYAKVDDPGLRDLLAKEATRELAGGFDGLFLDNADMVESHPAQAEGMVKLVARLDEVVGTHRLLFAQNGDDSVNAIAAHLDGWNREDVTATYDFDAKSYVRVSTQDRRDALATIDRLRARGLFVTTTDYTESGDDELAREAATIACKHQAVPFASDIDLRRIPSRPLTCP